jgi:hypothetical protein
MLPRTLRSPNTSSDPRCDITSASVGRAANVNLTLVWLLPADSWFDSKLRDGYPLNPLRRTSLRANRDSALWVKTPAASRWFRRGRRLEY